MTAVLEILQKMPSIEEKLRFIFAALQAIQNCLTYKKNFDEVSIENLLKKDGFQGIAEEMETPINSVQGFIEYIFKIAVESNEAEINEQAKKTIEVMITKKFKIPEAVKLLWNMEELQAKISVNNQAKTSGQLTKNNKIEFLTKAWLNVQYCARIQKKFELASIENFKQKDNNGEIFETLEVNCGSVDEYITFIFKLTEKLNDSKLNRSMLDAFGWMDQREIQIPEEIWVKCIEEIDSIRKIEGVDARKNIEHISFETADSVVEEDSETNKALLSTLCKLTKTMNINKPVRIESLRSSSQNVTEWFERFESQTAKWTNEDRGYEVVSFFEEMAFEKYKMLTSNKHDYAEIKKHMIKNLAKIKLKNKKAEFYSAKQRPDESVDQFGHRLLNYLTDLSETDKAELKKHLTEIFVDGVDGALQLHIINDSKLDFQEVWKKAKKLESCYKKKEETVLAINSNETVCGIENSKQKSYTVERNEQKPKCQFCGKDHYTVDCYGWKQFQQRNNTNFQSNQSNSNYQVNQNKPRFNARSATETREPKRTFDNSRLMRSVPNYSRATSFKCFNCNKEGHMSRNCNLNK